MRDSLNVGITSNANEFFPCGVRQPSDLLQRVEVTMRFGIQFEIETFVDDYAPEARAARERFVRKLRELMNEYARNAIKHGDIPEVGAPHNPLAASRTAVRRAEQKKET